METYQTSINKQIQSIVSELDNPQINKQRKRHLKDVLDLLDSYHLNHPEIFECPSYLEMYCDKNPNAPECRIHDL